MLVAVCEGGDLVTTNCIALVLLGLGVVGWDPWGILPVLR